MCLSTLVGVKVMLHHAKALEIIDWIRAMMANECKSFDPRLSYDVATQNFSSCLTVLRKHKSDMEPTLWLLTAKALLCLCVPRVLNGADQPWPLDTHDPVRIEALLTEVPVPAVVSRQKKKPQPKAGQAATEQSTAGKKRRSSRGAGAAAVVMPGDEGRVAVPWIVDQALMIDCTVLQLLCRSKVDMDLVTEVVNANVLFGITGKLDMFSGRQGAKPVSRWSLLRKVHKAIDDIQRRCSMLASSVVKLENRKFPSAIQFNINTRPPQLVEPNMKL